MNEKDINASFPVQIDLGKKESDPMAVSENVPSGTKRKPRTFYPTLYIDGIEGMPNLPKEGCMMIKFRRKRMSVEENYDGKETSGVTLEIQKLCLPEDMDDGDGGDMADELKAFAEGNGVDTGGEESDAKETDGDEDED